MPKFFSKFMSQLPRLSVIMPQMIMHKTIKSVLSPLVFLSLLATGSLFLSDTAQAANVYTCSAKGEKCIIKLEEGVISDRVKVLDEKARVVAVGRIVKRSGSYALISLTNRTKDIRKGYPVIVEIDKRDGSINWAASFSNSVD